MKKQFVHTLRNFSPTKAWKHRAEAKAHKLNIKRIIDSRLFQQKYYLDTYPDIQNYAGSPVVHFYFNGGREGRKPNPYFDSRWYLQTNKDVAASKIHPLIHYIRFGEREGRQPCPIFDPVWYRETYPEATSRAHQTLLSHYLRAGLANGASPSKFFDVSYYLSEYPDVAKSGTDPFLHYLHQGHAEGRRPNPTFDTNYYREKYCSDTSQNPLLHYLEHGLARGVRTQPREAEAPTVSGEQAYFTKPHPTLFAEHDAGIIKFRKTQVRLIAFYLPQYHAIPENDKWWGKGFTEWNSVARGLPRFVGHYQPRIPRDLGFYDLSREEVMKRQIELARSSGIEGFCFYFYWFDGRRLLERPLENFLRSDESFPFCIMWANENWTRTWDGLEKDVLIQQTYREEDEAGLLEEFTKLFLDNRYIRVGEQPLLVIYRPGLIPETKETIARWRAFFEREKGIRPLICMAQGFGDTDPTVFGLDGALEFPPHKLAADLDRANKSLRIVDADFAGHVHHYDDLVKRALAVTPQKFPLIRTVVPSWDNEARRPGRGTTFFGSTPAKYEAWLRRSIAFAKDHPLNGDSLVFVNAWNEWGEGAYLEPDVHFGSAYLNATARAVANRASHTKLSVLLFGHDCYPHGAQLLLLNIAKTLTRQFGVEVVIVVAGGGPLLPKYKEIAEVRLCAPDPESLQSAISGLYQDGHHYAVANTTVSGWAVPVLKSAGLRVASLVHELPRLIEVYKLAGEAEAISQSADKIVFASDVVRKGFEKVLGSALDDEKTVILAQGVYNSWRSDPNATERFRKSLGLGSDDKLIINVGYGDLRKGIDIFLSVAKYLIEQRSDVHFAWIGNMDTATIEWLSDDLDDPGISSRLHLIAHMDDPVPAYEGADAFFLSSREDPYPTVVMEAFRAGLPVIALSGGGGYEDLVRANGRLASRNSIVDIAAKLEEAIDQASDKKELEAARLRQFAQDRFRFDDYVMRLVRLLEPAVPSISVVVPNYNYAKYLPSRLDSIFDQILPLYEVFILDDASSDDSLSVIDEYLSSNKRIAKILRNEVNSGSGYLQWRKGVEAACAEYVWIAEADDWSQPQFLEEAVALASAENAAFVFTDSAQMDAEGNTLGESYGFYFSKVDHNQFTTTFSMNGQEFARRYLTVRNIILNVSGVLWRRDALLKAFDEVQGCLSDFKLAADWLIYLTAALASERVGYIAKPLNHHRRHQVSVTHALAKEAHLAEISRVHSFIKQRVQVDDRLAAEMRAYIEELAAQFNLEVPSTRDENPRQVALP